MSKPSRAAGSSEPAAAKDTTRQRHSGRIAELGRLWILPRSADFQSSLSVSPGILAGSANFSGGVKLVAQVSKPAVSPTSKSATLPHSKGPRIWKSATQQTWKSALLWLRRQPRCAVSPISNRQSVETSEGAECFSASQAGSLRHSRLGNLRYEGSVRMRPRNCAAPIEHWPAIENGVSG
jgi:hypothetical protein